MHVPLRDGLLRDGLLRDGLLHAGILFGGLALLTTPCAAQSHVVSPRAEYASSEGGGSSFTFGSYAAGRYQFADGNQRNQAMSVKSIAFRHDHRNYDITEGMGRTWSRVTIQMAECTLPSFGAVYSANSTTTPTKVFDGTVNWPIQLGVRSTLPAPWSLAIPFTSAWSYSGTRDLLTDFMFSGGSLSNRDTWSGTDSRPYVLDSFGVGLLSRGPQSSMGRVNGGCSDSSSTRKVGASVSLDAISFGPNVSNPSLRNRFVVEANGANFAASTPTVFVLAFAADRTGMAFPNVKCNRFHLSTQRLWFYHPVMPGVTGNIGPYRFGYTNGAAYTPAYLGINVVVQGVWADTSHGGLLLSSAARNSFVAIPPANAGDVKMKAAYGSNQASSMAASVANGDGARIPLLRYGN